MTTIDHSNKRHTISHRINLVVLLFVALLLLGFSLEAQADSRHALVIGNSNYGSGFSLSNPINDSTAIVEKLTSIGYKIHKNRALVDLNLDEFNNEIDAFLESIEDGSSTLIYYAGHGSASAGENFLIPILPDGVRLETQSDIRNRSVSLGGILERIQHYNPSGVNVLFIDACRDAPVRKSSRSINLTGLTSLDTRWQPQGTFVGFSTEYGQIAVDGPSNGLSPFAAAVLSNLNTRADEPIELFYKSVSNEVYNSTLGKQFPIQEPKIRGNYCLIPCKTIASDVAQNQVFGNLTVLSNPESAEVCYRVEGEWADWNCAHQMALPIGKLVSVKVSAKNYSTHTMAITLQSSEQELMVNLKRRNSWGYKVAGAIAAAVVTGVLISRSSDSAEADDYRITLTLPTQ